MKISIRYLLGLLLALGLLAATAPPAKAYFGISVNIAPPPLPVVVQPECPGDGYIWTPGYWAWDPTDEGYYWVPGAWVISPEVGLLWTPCWWGWQDGAYCFHPGYWGRNVGFYGGIDYGHGYYGRGYDGGRWHGDHFYYNRSANNVGGIASSRLYSHGVAGRGSRVSFNGGRGGTTAVATADERRAAGEHHLSATSAQNTLAHSARTDPGQRFSANHGTPAVTGTARAGALKAGANSAAKGAVPHNAVAGTQNRTNQRGESAFTGERSTSHVASAGQTHTNLHGESALAGEPHTSVRDERNVTSNTRTVSRGESAFTGASATRHVSSGSSIAEHRTPNSQPIERHVSAAPAVESVRHFSAPHVSSAPSREPAMRSSGGGFSHSSVSSHGGGGFSRGPVSHGGGFGGGAHASVSHGGGGRGPSGGAGHGGPGPGGGNNHH